MARWSLRAGRHLYLDGKPAIYIGRVEPKDGSSPALAPWEVDKITHVIARCLTKSKSKDRFGSCCLSGIKQERREHPWMTLAQARRIVADHARKKRRR